VEQLVIEAIGDDEVYARTRALSPQCLLNGAPFLEGRLAPTSMLELGQLGLCVTRIARQDDVKRRSSPSNSATSPVVQALGLLTVAFGLWFVLSPQPKQATLISDVVEPPLPAAAQQQPCPLADAVGASALALQTALDAQAKRERAPFYPGEGVAAARLFTRAAACFDLAGEPTAAESARLASRELSARAADAIHVGHVRLERALAEGDLVAARHQAQLSAELLERTGDGQYAQWLSTVLRACDLGLEQKP
jgi:hypothetical protein